MPALRLLPLLFVLFFVLYALGAFWGLPSALTPAIDSISPLGPLAFVGKYKQTDMTYVYPAVHQLLQVAVYAVVLLIAKITGSIGTISSAWPYGFRDPSALFTVLLVVSNLISAAMAAFLLRTLWRMRPDPAAAQWFAIFLLGLSGVFAYYARTANMDMPYLFWIVLAWHQLWLYLTAPANSDEYAQNGLVRGGVRGRIQRWLAATGLWASNFRPLLLAGLFSALSFGSKDQASTIIFGFGLLLLLYAPVGGKGGWRLRLRQATMFSAAVAICYAVFAIAPQPARWWYHVRFVTQNPAIHITPETPAGLWGQILLFERCYLRLHHIFTYAGLPLAVAGIVILWRRGRHRELALLLVPALTYYAAVIARVRAPEERYLLPIAIPLVLCAGVAIGALRDLPRGRKPAYALAAGTLAAQLVFSFFPVTYCQLFDTKRDLQRYLSSLLPPQTPIAIHGMQTLNYPNRLIYDQYRLMLAPGQAIVPISTHPANLLHPFDPAVRHVFTGTPQPPPDGAYRLLGQWRYTNWIRTHVHVPATHEFFLYERQ
jgi:hypothetical protein